MATRGVVAVLAVLAVVVVAAEGLERNRGRREAGEFRRRPEFGVDALAPQPAKLSAFGLDLLRIVVGW